MHIALWSPGWPLEKHQNGIVTYVHWMKLELERSGHRVSVFTGKVDASVIDPDVHHVRRGWWGITVRRLARRLFSTERDIFEWGAVIARHMLEVHRRDPIDVIEMEESFGWSADVSRITSIPVLVKLHGPAFLSLIDEELTTPFARERVEREGRALALATAIASPSSLTLKQTLERYQLAPRIQQHVVNPLTMDERTPVWRLDACDPKTILFVGRFDKRKGADVVLHAFELLLRERPELKLVFVGPDSGLSQPDGTRIHLEAFRAAVFPEALRGRVEFRGRMANRDIAALRVQAMVTVIASRWENQGYTALEAMFQGCPVVVSDAGGSPESVVDGRTGLLTRSEDAGHFASRLRAMVDDPQAAAAMGTAARRHVIETHSAAKVASESLLLYERLIALVRSNVRHGGGDRSTTRARAS
jgi:glycosyltransferase involved in cell wall biosynthesis